MVVNAVRNGGVVLLQDLSRGKSSSMLVGNGVCDGESRSMVGEVVSFGGCACWEGPWMVEYGDDDRQAPGGGGSGPS